LVNQGRDEYALHESANLNTPTPQGEATGYLHALYCQSLSEFGTPRFLRESGGWILERQIPNSRQLDAMGCYPLFACQHWSQLHVDLDELQSDLVSLAIVADPFGEHDPAYLRKCFPDRVVPFKEHMVIDLSRSPESFVDAHHRRNARKALERLNVERCADATLFGDEWNSLYANLVERHGLRGLTAFSATSFRAQLAVPGMVMFRATHGDETVGMTLWYADRSVAYYHLGAYSEAGYELRASFALFWRVIEYFSTRGLQWLNLGAGAGLSGNRQEDGLSRFKRGWATGTRTAYFCGRIFDQQRYAEAMGIRQVAASDYFPAYRKGEFG
jgi:hypothetical protein